MRGAFDYMIILLILLDLKVNLIIRVYIPEDRSWQSNCRVDYTGVTQR